MDLITLIACRDLLSSQREAIYINIIKLSRERTIHAYCNLESDLECHLQSSRSPTDL